MLFSFIRANAQVADTLKEVNIQAKKEQRSNDARINSYSPGQNVITIDKRTLEQYEFQDMANLLSQQVPVFVKSYGLNNIATLNFRGASAAQSQVYWNGIPIQNAALGIADVSLLPVALMNKVNVVYGSSSALWGSGNVGGALLVENDLPEYNVGGNFSQSASVVAGSFGHYRIGTKSEYSNERLALSANLFGQTAQNSFSYIDVDGDAQTMNNSRLQSGVALLQGAYKIDNYNTVTARGWYQQYYREIPPALFESASYKNQRDESLRLMIDWNHSRGASKLYAKAAYINDLLWYRDSVVSVDTRNRTDQVYLEAGLEHKLNLRHKVLLFAPVQLASMQRPIVGDRFTQNRYAIAGAYVYGAFYDWDRRDNKLQVALNGRAEVVDDNSYILPGINASYSFSDRFMIRANMQRTYRVPTLNELYYIPGGNPDLEPEQGWNTDIGYTVNTGRYKKQEDDNVRIIQREEAVELIPMSAPQQKKIIATHSLSAYNRVIHNWIIWFGGAIWTPHNIATVDSRGLQTENKLTWNINSNWQAHIMLNGAYTIATTVASYAPGDGSIGKQIPYTPLYNGQGNIGINYKKLYINYNHTYTGLRYITVDESYGLRAYTLGNLQMMYNVKLGSNQLRFTAQANNIWDTQYQVVNARPMPGINWLLGVGFTLN